MTERTEPRPGDVWRDDKGKFRRPWDEWSATAVRVWPVEEKIEKSWSESGQPIVVKHLCEIATYLRSQSQYMFEAWASGAAELLHQLINEKQEQPAAGTVRVRAAVAMDPTDRSVIVYGWDVAAVTDKDISEHARRELGRGDRVPIIAFIEADIPIPQQPTIPATIVAAAHEQESTQ